MAPHFELVCGGPDEDDRSLKSGASTLMIGAVAEFYCPDYNAAIRARQSGFTVADPDGNWLTFWKACEAG